MAKRDRNGKTLKAVSPPSKIQPLVTREEYDEAKATIKAKIEASRDASGRHFDTPVLIDAEDVAAFRATQQSLLPALGLRAVWRDGVLSYVPVD